MNFDYSDEERLAKDQARRFLADYAPASLLRAMLDGGGGEAATRLWREAAALGWPGVAVPEVYGGLGIGYVTLCALAEEIGRAAAPVPMFASIYLAAEALLLFGDEAQKRRHLPGLAAGERIGTAALGEGAGLEPPFRLQTSRLDGVAAAVPHGMAADLAIVAAQEDGSRTGLFLVDLAAAGVERAPIRTIDDTHPHARLNFTGVAAERLERADDGMAARQRLLARAAVLVAFEQLGGADACLDMAVRYALERRSFGRPIGSYQAIKHKLADMYIKNELARSNAYYGAWALAEDAPVLELAAATARVSAIHAYDFAASENIQVHGGMGFTWEADCHLHYRRARLLAQALGPIAAWQDRLVAALDHA